MEFYKEINKLNIRMLIHFPNKRSYEVFFFNLELNENLVANETSDRPLEVLTAAPISIT